MSWVILAIIAGLVIYGITTYNGLVGLRQEKGQP